MTPQELIDLIRDERDTKRMDMLQTIGDHSREKPIFGFSESKDRKRYLQCLSVPLEQILCLELNPLERISLFEKIFDRPLRGEVNLTNVEASAFSRVINGAVRTHGKSIVSQAIEGIINERQHTHTQ